VLHVTIIFLRVSLEKWSLISKFLIKNFYLFFTISLPTNFNLPPPHNLLGKEYSKGPV
jgi:hypothetical protein